MRLAALIAAYHESAEPGRLRAALPLAGRTVVERQVRLAAAAGASPVLVLAERMPADLAAAIERMRREHLPVRLVRSAEEAAETIEATDRLLLIADGAIADAATLAGLAAGEGPAVLTVGEAGHGDIYERIDAQARWAGAAVLDGALLRSTVAMLRDWDLQSTLLRRILQAAARQVAAAGPVAILDAAEDLEVLERRILAAANATGGGWAERLLAPLERLLAALLIASPLAPAIPGSVALLATFAGAAAFAMHWPWTGLVLSLLATPLDGAAARLAQVRMQGDPAHSWWRHVLPYASALGLLGLATSFAPGVGWGMILAALVTIAFLIAQGIELRDAPPTGRLLLAEPKGMTWLLLPFAIFGQWAAGIAVLTGYAAASFFWSQRLAHSRLPRNGTAETG